MEPIAETTNGRVRGVREGALCVFRGVPFAAPPTGALRWAAPRPAASWTGVRDATAFGPEAPQPPSLLTFDRGLGATAEACLTLNVWTPDVAVGRRPVMVWIHGGGFQTGGTARSLYSGAPLAASGDVVFISIQYRLGILGLLTHPALADHGADAASGASGNWALLDQLAALRWIRHNAAAFGGDPDQVTIFGESAGGASVSLLLTSPLARGLFRRAIVQSASPLPIDEAQSQAAAAAVCESLGVGSPARLRDLPVDKLIDAQPRWAEVTAAGRTAPRPCRAAPVLPHWPDEAIDAGLTAGVELLVGANRDEWNLFGMLDPKRESLDAAGLHARIVRTLPDASHADRVAEAYRDARGQRGESTEPWALWSAIETDRLIRAPAQRFLARHCARGERGYGYLVTWESPLPGFGACHGVELPFCLGTLEQTPEIAQFAGTGPEASALMKQMRDAWLGFARGDAPDHFATPPETTVFGSAGRDEPERAVWELL